MKISDTGRVRKTAVSHGGQLAARATRTHSSPIERLRIRSQADREPVRSSPNLAIPTSTRQSLASLRRGCQSRSPTPGRRHMPVGERTVFSSSWAVPGPTICSTPVALATAAPTLVKPWDDQGRSLRNGRTVPALAARSESPPPDGPHHRLRSRASPIPGSARNAVSAAWTAPCPGAARYVSVSWCRVPSASSTSTSTLTVSASECCRAARYLATARSDRALTATATVLLPRSP